MFMTRNKYPLTTQTTKLFVVIRKNKKISKELIKTYCEEYYEQYAFIEHEKDIEPVTGQVEGCHYHIVGVAKKKKTPLQTHLNDLVRFFRFKDPNGVQIDKYENVVSAVQYLIHKNNPEKTQHKFEDITYKWDKEEFMLMMSSEQTEIISFDMVYSVCSTSKNILEVIKGIGFKTYHKYRATIWDIWNEIKKV